MHIRLPTDPGPNPYDSKTAIKDLPPKDWQIAGRGIEWWASILAFGILFGVVAYLKATSIV